MSLYRRLAPVAGLLAALALAGPSEAAELEQLTAATGCTSTAPVASSDGSIGAWQSTCNPTGQNADGSLEIFRAVAGQPPVQLTNGPATCSSSRPSINGNGNSIAFESTCNLTGQNSDGSVEIFLWKSGGITQLTVSNSTCDNLAPSISRNNAGSFIAYDSTCNSAGTSNDGRGAEIFRLPSTGGTPEQLTFDADGQCESTSASISNDGDVVAFDSDCNLAGLNEDRAIEIFTVKVSAGKQIKQLTSAPEDSCSSVRPSINSSGSLIAFYGDCNFTGGNADRSDEIFTVTGSGEITQITSTAAGSSCASGEPRMAANGTALSFSSYCSFSNGQTVLNADKSVEVFQVGVGKARGGIFMLTDGGGGCSSLAGGISADGTRVFLDSDCNLEVNNTDGSVEIYRGLACACGTPASRRSEPTTSDALFALKAAVNSASCNLCDCDANGNGVVQSSDALLILKAAVGQSIALNCPLPS